MSSDNNDKLQNGLGEGASSGGDDTPATSSTYSTSEIESPETRETPAGDSPLATTPLGHPTADMPSSPGAVAPNYTPAQAPQSPQSKGAAGKVIAVIAVVAAIAALGYWAQRSFSSANTIKLTSRDMELLVNEAMPKMQAQMLATNAEQRKEFSKQLKEMLSIAQLAEKEGYATKPDVKPMIDLQEDLALRDAYLKKNPDAEATDDEVNAYMEKNSAAFDSLLSTNTQLKAQAEGPQGEMLKKEFGQIKVIADRARQEKLDQDELTKLKMRLGRYTALFQSYMRNKVEDKNLVTDADIEKYYQEHQDDYQEVRARHILISTQSEMPQDAAHGKAGKADSAPKGLSKEEARKKAESVLARVRGGEDFAKLAEEFSDDPGSKKTGGLLMMDESGSDESKYFRKGMMVEAFEKAAFSLQPGQTSDIVETDYGYHIIHVEDRRTAPVTSAELREEITNKLKQDKIKSFIEGVAKNSKVEVAEDFKVEPAASSPQFPSMPPQAPPSTEKGTPQKQ